MEFELYDGELNVKIDVTDEMKEAIFNRVLEYMKKNNCTSGEHLHQSDDCILEAPECLSDIIDDIIRPETTWQGED